MSQARNPGTILFVEDADEDFETMRMMMREQGLKNPIDRCVDGEVAWRYLKPPPPAIAPHRPALVLLDLNLGHTDGRALLRRIKGDAKLRDMIVIVLTTSSNPADVKACYQSGANGYAVKPIGLENVARLIESIKLCWLDMMEVPA